MKPSQETFSKPFFTIEQQIELLKTRGMLFHDEHKAKQAFENLNYYRLSGYWLVFQDSKDSHTFIEGTSFEDVLNLYIFDREFRLLLLDAIERIEVSIRTRLAHELCETYGSHPHLKPEIFNCPIKYAQTIMKLNSELSRSKEVFIKHFKNKYKEPLPPLWSSVELMTLGQVSYWFSNIKLRKDRIKIASYYQLDEKILGSFLHHLTVVRNICAHHSIIWNKKLTVDFIIPKQLASLFNEESRKYIFNTLVMIDSLMNIISPSSTWKERLESLIDKHDIDKRKMGYK